MALIRDINEYRLCAKNFNSPIVDKLFGVLYSLSNLLVVKPGNLQEICAGESLVIIIYFRSYLNFKKQIFILMYFDFSRS